MGIWWNRVELSNPFIDDPMLKEIVVPEDHFVFKTMDGALVGRQGTVLPSQFAGVKETKECTREIEVHSWNDGVEEEKATCEFEGIIRHTCKYCNQTKAEFTAAPTKAPINSKEQAATKIADNAFKGDRKLTESCLEVRGFRKR